jgi:hypothetical protein
MTKAALSAAFIGGGEGSRTIATHFTYCILLSHIFLIILVKSGFEQYIFLLFSLTVCSIIIEYFLVFEG